MGVGLFFRGRGGEGEGGGEVLVARTCAQATARAAARPQGVKSFDDNPGSGGQPRGQALPPGSC